MKYFFLYLALTIFLIHSKAFADDDFQDFFSYCTYGVVTGMLIGGASLALAEDPGSNLAPITKGASLGLYAGALVSVYKNWYGPKNTRIEIGTHKIEKSPEAQLAPDLLIIPQTQGLSFALKWEL
jgi:hypothetical protein